MTCTHLHYQWGAFIPSDIPGTVQSNHKRTFNFFFLFYFCQAVEKYLLPERDDIGTKPYKVFLGTCPAMNSWYKTFPNTWVSAASQHQTFICLLFSNRTILKVAQRCELLSVPTGFVSSPWALNQGGRNKRPGPFFSGTVGTCILARWQKAAEEVLGTFWGSSTFFTQNKQSEILHQGILQAHYPTWWRPVGIP